MSKPLTCRAIIAASALLGCAPILAHAKPKLVVQITSDQLRGDLLDRYRSALTHGFARIEQNGYWVHKGDVDHALTVSYPGHATLATGMFPSHHGLTANEWWVELGGGNWNEIDVTDDANYKIVNVPEGHGNSPHNMLASTLGEWIKAADPAAKSIALGTGGGIPVAYAGKKADAVYWFVSSLNAFSTSTYYANAIAPWVAEFNAKDLPAFQAQEWSLTVTPIERALAVADATPHENGGRNTTFPHRFAVESLPEKAGDKPRTYGQWYGGTPLKDEALLSLAARAIDAERLGQRGATDYLAIDLDATDSVGHAFGPRSLEQLDTLKRLDIALERFLDHLDKTVGRDNYVLALSADHGVVDAREPGVNGRQVTAAELEALLDKVEAVAARKHASEAELKQEIVATLRQADFVADAYTEERLAAPSNDPYIRLYRNAMLKGKVADFPLWTYRDRLHHPARYGIVVRFKENITIDAAIGVHGSPYPNDRLVPILFYGAGIRRGQRTQGGRTVDVAPTLAAAAGIHTPSDLDGSVIRDALTARSDRKE